MILAVRPAPTRTLSRAEEVAAEIEASETRHTRVIRDESLLIIHHIAYPVGEYWDVFYGVHISDEEIMEFVDLEEAVFKRSGKRLRDLEVERQEIDRPNRHFPDSPSHTFVRLCPKMVSF